MLSLRSGQLFIAAIAALGIPAYSHADPSQDGQAALQAFLSTGMAEPCSDPSAPSRQHPVASDLAKHLAMLSEGNGKISSRCEATGSEASVCTVSVGQDAGELVWGRYYRFRWAAEVGVAPGSVECFTIP